jgi:hypothetical protein
VRGDKEMFKLVANPDVSSGWDKTGIATSMICIVHCILTPFLAAALPILAVTEQGTHIGFTIALLAIGSVAFMPGYRKHGRRSMVYMGMLGFLMLCAAVILPETLATEAIETSLTVIGGGFLIIAHLCNMYFCLNCSICNEDPCRSDSE